MPKKSYSVILRGESSLTESEIVARDKIRNWLLNPTVLGENKTEVPLSQKEVLLRDTLNLSDEYDYLPLQVNSLEVNLLANGAAYEHGATFALALIIGYLISVLTQLYKDKTRFFKLDVSDRIELQKIKRKLISKRKQLRSANQSKASVATS